MVIADFDRESRTGRIVLTPNRSWSWRANLIFLGVLSVVCLVIGTAFFLQGLWLILPFSILEVSLVGLAMYYCVRRTHSQEVLTFSDDELMIESGRRKPEKRHVFKRLFARVFIRRPRHPWYPTRIAVRSHGREVEVGDFLSPEDKDLLITELKRMISALEEQQPAAD